MDIKDILVIVFIIFFYIVLQIIFTFNFKRIASKCNYDCKLCDVYDCPSKYCYFKRSTSENGEGS